MLKSWIYRALSNFPVTTKMLAHLRLNAADSFLSRAGWFESFRRGLPIDADGHPIPWFTYGATMFLESRLRRDMRVFEFGSGNSTLWWAEHVDALVSCEHDPGWYEKMKSKLPSRVGYQLRKVENESYARSVTEASTLFHLIVIDGADRIRCAEYAFRALLPEGVLVWDNSDRKDYERGYEALESRGFRRLNFFGVGPINAPGWCTTIFYRSGNCLNI